MEICREHLYSVLRFADKNPSRIGSCDSCETNPMDCQKEKLDHYDTDRIINSISGAKEALSKAVSVIYFDDNSDYESALWEIVSILGGKEAADLLESDESAAYQKYCEGAVEQAFAARPKPAA